jgi:glucokinase
MNKKNIVVGVDIGGTNTKLGLVTEQGKCLTESKFKTQNYPQPEKFFNHLTKKIVQLFPQQSGFPVIHDKHTNHIYLYGH